MTMADLLAKSKSGAKSLKMGQKVTGKVTQILSKSLIIDIGGKAEAMVSEKGFAEAREFISKLKVGDEINATVLVPEMRDGSVLLSLRDSISTSLWKSIEDVYKKGSEIPVVVKSATSSGVMVDANGIMGFIPLSQLSKDLSSEKDELVGKYFKAKVIDMDKIKNKLVLSEREVSEAEDIAATKKFLEKIKEGDLYEGKITTVANFGCFVKLDVKEAEVEGLVHISELSWSKVVHPNEVVKVGQKVKVRVIGKNLDVSGKGLGKLSLSIKNAQKDPWTNIEKEVKKDDKVSGKVIKVTDFGVFIEIKPGVEGLVHITKIAPGKRFSVGDMANCYIEEIDAKNRKISLGLVLTEIPLGYK